MMHVMHTKLTLRMEEDLVRRAKAEAAQRGKSVSQMFGDFVANLEPVDSETRPLPPVTRSLLGLLRESPDSEEAYKAHLEIKHG